MPSAVCRGQSSSNPMDITEQFSRTAMLLGEEKMQKLFAAKVAVFGVGGVGSYTAEALARSGIGSIDLFDNDLVCISNINRQIIALHSSVGKYKVDVMRERILDINPNAKVGAFRMFYLPENADEVDLSIYDYVVDAVDTVTAKVELIVRAKAAGTPIICSMGAANKLDPTAFVVADIRKTEMDPLAKVIRKELRARGIKDVKVVYSKEPASVPLGDEESVLSQDSNKRQTPASNSFVPPVVGMILAGEVIKDLTTS